MSVILYADVSRTSENPLELVNMSGDPHSLSNILAEHHNTNIDTVEPSLNRDKTTVNQQHGGEYNISGCSRSPLID